MVPSQATNGVLPVPAAVLQKQSPPSNAPRGPARSKPTSPRSKVVIRRLPPGLTEEEFQGVLGDEWKAGGGKVDWFQYKPGKISKEYVLSGSLFTALFSEYTLPGCQDLTPRM
jgi:regulator of nonsense transcripts 3